MPFSERQRRLSADIVTLLAGLLVPLAFAPFNQPWLLFPALIILLLGWHNATPGRAFRRGYLFGFGLFGFGVYWLHISINLFGGVNLILALTATYLLVAFLALYPALCGWLLKRYFSQQPLLALVVAAPALWAMLEWLRSWLLTGFPWLNLGYSQIETILGGYAPVLGVYGVSWLCMTIAGAIAALFVAKQSHPRLMMLAVIAVALTIGLLARDYQWTQDKPGTRQVALVQGAVPQAIKWQPEQLQATMQLYHELTMPYWQKADLIIWPETAIPAFAHQINDYLDLMREQAVAANTPLITGLATQDDTSDAYYNSLLVIGGHKDIYNKRHLVPFGEYLPLEFLVGPLLRFLKIPMSDFTPGAAERPLLDVGDYQAGVSICYEDVFGEEIIAALPEAEILINVSNDAWFGDSIAPHQHLQMARFRALETGRYLLRATNTGITAVIDKYGQVTTQVPQFTPKTLMAKVQLHGGATPYVLVGNSAIILLSLLNLFILLFMNRRQMYTSSKGVES